MQSIPPPTDIRFRNHRPSAVVAALVGVFILAVLFYARAQNAIPFESLRLALFDTLAWQLNRSSALIIDDVLVIDIDDASVQMIGQWPWPRDRLAEIVEAAAQGGAKTIAFDMVFSESDRLSLESMSKVIEAYDPALAAEVRALPSSDDHFTAAIAGAPVVLGLAATLTAGLSPSQPGRFVVRGGHTDIAPPTFAGAVSNLHELELVASGLGVTNIFADADGVTRRVPLMLRIGETIYPSLALEALRVRLGVDTLVATPDGIGGVSNISVGPIEVRTDAAGAIWPPIARVQMHVEPAHRVLSGELAPEAFRDKLVIVGVSASGAAPYANIGGGLQAPSHYLHAAAAGAVLVGAGGYRPSYFAPIESVTAAIAALTVLLASIFGHRGVALTFFLGCPAAAFLVTFAAFTERTALVDATLICVAMAVIGAYLVAYLLLAQRLTLLYERSFVGRVVASMSEGLVVSDREGAIVSVNPAAERLLAGRGTHVLLPSAQQEQMYDATRRVVEPDANVEDAPALEIDSAWIEDRGQQFRVQVLRDVTKLQMAENAASLASARLSSATEGMADGLALFDQNGQLVFHNPAVLAIAGQELSENLTTLDYTAFMDMVFRGEGDQEDAPFDSFAARQTLLAKGGGLENERLTPLGRWVLARERQTQEDGIVCVYTDITQLKDTAQALGDAQLAAVRASEAKDRFFATVSHELRTPLNAILGFADSMCLQLFGPIENARYQNYLRHIMTSGEELLDLVENLLDVAASEQPEFVIQLVPVDLQTLLEQVEQTFRPQFEKAGMILQLDVDGEMPPCALDQRAIRRIVSNLLSNALKYGASPVTLKANYQEATGHEIVVADVGSGMAAEQVARAFEPFWQGQFEGGVNSSAGMGLGLTLVKTLAERQGGAVEVASAPGAGAVFRLSFRPVKDRPSPYGAKDSAL